MVSEDARRALIYGSIATAIVSLLSLCGAVIVPLLRGNSKHRWMHFFVAMAVSTLSSDALLHIIPQIMGLHDHGSHNDSLGHNHSHAGHHHHHHEHEHEHHEHHELEGNHSMEHDHDHDHDLQNVTLAPEAHTAEEVSTFTITPEREILLFLSLIMLSIYALYLIEFVIFYRKRQHCPADKISNKTQITHCGETVSNHAWEEEPSCHEHNTDSQRSELSVIDEAHEEEAILCCGLKSRAIVILFGDAAHNLVDGLAIGASFLTSTQMGVVTTIAVVCHELPHELGDLAVLLDSGLSMGKALFLNLLSALTAFIGLYISIALGSNEIAERCLLAITAGMFLYVAWIDMLAHLKHDGVHKDHWIFACLLQYSGFAVGFCVIFLLGWFEDQIFH